MLWLQKVGALLVILALLATPLQQMVKLGAWQSVWEHLLANNPRMLDLSSAQLDGTIQTDFSGTYYSEIIYRKTNHFS